MDEQLPDADTAKAAFVASVGAFRLQQVRRPGASRPPGARLEAAASRVMGNRCPYGALRLQ